MSILLELLLGSATGSILDVLSFLFPGGYIGCFKDDANRILREEQGLKSTSVSIDMCNKRCLERQFTFFGLQVCIFQL